MQPETEFKLKVLAALKKLPRTWCVKTQQVSIRGTPDILCSIGGTFVALELKRSQEAKVDPLQEHTLQKIRDAGGMALVVWPENWPPILAVIEALAYGAAGVA